MSGPIQDLYASPCTSPEGTLVASKSSSSTINDKTAIQLLTKLDEVGTSSSTTQPPPPPPPLDTRVSHSCLISRDWKHYPTYAPS